MRSSERGDGAPAWSLARRLTGLFLVSTTFFVLLIAATSTWHLVRAIDKDIDSLAEEETEKAHFMLRELPQSPADFERIAQALDTENSKDRIALRVWKPGQSEPWGEFGVRELLVDAGPARAPLGKTIDLGHGHRWRSVELSSGWVLGVAVDGSPNFLLLQRFLIGVAVIVAACIGISLLVGRLFIQRVSQLLHRVAESARSVRSPGTAIEVDIEGAPQEIREVATALQEALAHLRTESEEARVFTAGLAHELRSPVQNLIGETEVALIAPRDADTYREVLQSHLEELRSLGDAIDNLVTICTAGETHRTRVREGFDLAAEARLRLARERGAAERAGVELTLQSSGDTHIEGDREALLRALRNLTANAIQWSAPSGKVLVAIEGHAHEIEIRVDDSGPGVPEELRAKIFQPFFRGPQARGRRIGYGLGLAITRSAVDEQQGRIEVGAAPLGGARFQVWLPRAVSQATGE